jgi:transcriptional regulator with XRE-family HTH domain
MERKDGAMKRENKRSAVGRNIRQARKAAGMTQCELAKKIGMRQATLSAWERGGVSQKIDGLAAIAKATNVAIETLL